MRTLIAIFSLIASAPSAEVAQAPDDNIGILRTILADAPTRWRALPAPCLADHLKNFADPGISTLQVSRLLGTHIPFSICPDKLGKRYFRVSKARISRGYALVEFDYVCPLCGGGTLYTLRQREGRWSVVRWERTWKS
jgi:hypothetical protein